MSTLEKSSLPWKNRSYLVSKTRVPNTKHTIQFYTSFVTDSQTVKLYDGIGNKLSNCMPCKV